MVNVSVICTVKNGEETIRETINSVINQTMTEWEFIIIDDGSADNTPNILNEYAGIESRIKIVKTEGIGRGYALNLAVELSKADLITNIDADDLMHPQKLEIQYKAIKNNKRYFLLSTKAKIIYSNQIPSWNNIKIEDQAITIDEVTKKNFKKNQINHSSVMFYKKDLLSIGGYQNVRKSQYDYELWLRSAIKGLKLGKINISLVAKRVHKNQSYESKRLGQLWRSVCLQLKYILSNYKIQYVFYPFGRLILGILPFEVRQKINSRFNL